MHSTLSNLNVCRLVFCGCERVRCVSTSYLRQETRGISRPCRCPNRLPMSFANAAANADQWSTGDGMPS